MNSQTTKASAAGLVLFTLATGQFLMQLDSSVMNVAIATVAQDVGTTVTGVQTAITLYTLVMASLMITGGKIGQIIGRKKAFAIGCIIYGAGSFTTSISQTLPMLMFGWSFLEGVGAALILPAIVALVASNFEPSGRPRAYGLVAAAGAIAVATGPIIGGLFTTYLTWRWVFFGEVILVLMILALTRKIADAEVEGRTKIDVVGVVMSSAALALIVLSILKAGEWGLIRPKTGTDAWFGLSPSIFMLLGGGLLLWVFLMWETHRVNTNREPLVNPQILKNRQLQGGLTAFFFQYLLQSGLFFAFPLFLSVALGLSAIDTGVRALPLSITLLIAAAGVPKILPNASPRRVVRFGFALLFVSLVLLASLLDVGAGPEITTWPLLLAGLGIGSMLSQLGAVTVSAVPDDQSSEVGGLQNTFTNLGASIGTAMAGAIIISALTATLATGIHNNANIPSEVQAQASVQLASGVPFVSDQQLSTALTQAGVSQDVTNELVDENETARIAGLQMALMVLAGLTLVALLFTHKIPAKQPESSS